MTTPGNKYSIQETPKRKKHTRGKYRKWTAKDITYLRESYTTVPLPYLAVRFGVSVKSVKEQAKRQGIIK